MNLNQYKPIQIHLGSVLVTVFLFLLMQVHLHGGGGRRGLGETMQVDFHLHQGGVEGSAVPHVQVTGVAQVTCPKNPGTSFLQKGKPLRDAARSQRACRITQIEKTCFISHMLPFSKNTCIKLEENSACS